MPLGPKEVIGAIQKMAIDKRGCFVYLKNANPPVTPSGGYLLLEPSSEFDRMYSALLAAAVNGLAIRFGLEANLTENQPATITTFTIEFLPPR